MRILILLQGYNTKRIPYEKWFLDMVGRFCWAMMGDVNINFLFLIHENIEFLVASGLRVAVTAPVKQEFSRQMVLFWFYSDKGTPKETDLRSGMLPLLQQGGLP
ncbi:hypothetical protein [Roseinatronobacter sp. NSM]|uniref:hypothetical protein n=1 Tax=Roseinatronobacter sp. NSM TaxID=3457785 RepID=UPI004036448E